MFSLNSETDGSLSIRSCVYIFTVSFVFEKVLGLPLAMVGRQTESQHQPFSDHMRCTKQEDIAVFSENNVNSTRCIKPGKLGLSLARRLAMLVSTASELMCKVI